MTRYCVLEAGRASIVAIAFAALAAGCGGAQESPTEPVAVARPVQDPDPRVRTYVAELTPLNEDIRGREVTGLATFSIDERNGTLETIIRAKNVDRQVPARVFLSGDVPGATCPTIDADDNGDDLIDASEAVPFAGAAVIPLTQAQTDISRVERPDFEDGVVILYGSPEGTQADAADPSLRPPPPALMPIACGEVTRIN